MTVDIAKAVVETAGMLQIIMMNTQKIGDTKNDAIMAHDNHAVHVTNFDVEHPRLVGTRPIIDAPKGIQPAHTKVGMLYLRLIDSTNLKNDRF